MADRFRTFGRYPILLCSLGLAGCGGSGSPTAIAFSHVSVITPGQTTFASDQTVVVDSGRIVQVAPASEVRLGSKARAVDGTGKYLIPGLWDMHVHLSLAGACTLPLFVANGVTGVRDLGGSIELVRALRDSINAGHLVGPRIKLAGPIIEDARWLEAVLGFLKKSGDTIMLRELQNRPGVSTVEEARHVVDSLAGLGVDVIKVRNAPSPEVFLAIVSEAKAKGLRVAAHAPPMDLRQAAEAGAGSLEHTETVTMAIQRSGGSAEEVGRAMARHSTWLTPTLVAQYYWRVIPDSAAFRMIADTTDERGRYVSPRVRASWRSQMDMKKGETPRDWNKLNAEQLADFEVLRDAGAPMLAGTDLGAVLVYPGFGLHEELELLVKTGGLTPPAALASATRNPAAFFRADSTVGRIVPGAEADVVLLNANPLTDIRNTKRIEAVMLRGTLFDRAALDGLLATAAQGVRGGSCAVPMPAPSR